MALAHEISAETFEGLNDTLKAEYKKTGDSYKLDVTGLPDVGALTRAKDRETTEKNQFKARVTELETANADLTQKMTDLSASHETAIKTALTDANSRIEKLTGHVRKQLVDDVAFRIASEISTSPDLMQPHIASRLQADFDGDTPVTRILDKSGKVIEKADFDALKKELADDTRFRAIIKGSGATGGGASRHVRQSSAGGASQTGNEKPNLGLMTPKQLVEYRRANPKSE